MTLINPLLFALGIAAMAAPVWVHLRQGRVRKRVVVSSLHLMLAARQTSRSPRRIINWPLFLLRCLLLLLLALGFGRLLIPFLGGGGAQAYAVFVVDISGSMRAEDAGEPRWSQARTALQAAIRRLDAASQVALVTSPAGDAPSRWESPADARARAARLVPGHAANRLAPDLREAIRLLAQMPDDNPKILHVISDFQRSALSGIDQVALPLNIELRIDKVGPLQARNRGVTVSVLSAGAADIGLYGFTDGTSGEITIVENGETEKPFTVSPGKAVSRVAGSDRQPGWTERQLVLSHDDALAADNVAYDAFLPHATLPVWLFEPRDRPPAPDPRARRSRVDAGSSVVQVYDQATYFIRTALQPSFGEESSESRFRPLVLTADDLPAALTALEQSEAPRLLFVPAVAGIPRTLAQLADGIVARGGAVVFLSGPELVPSAYQSAFAPLLPARIGARETVSLTPSLASVSGRHPLWGSLDNQTRRLFDQVDVRQRSAIELHEEARPLAYFTDGEPLVVERTIGSGRTYFVNTSADRQWSDWPAAPSTYVPFIHLLVARALGYAAFEPAHQPLLAGERTTLKLDSAHAGRTVLFNGRRLDVDADGYVHDVRVEEPGIVDLTLDDGTIIRRVAVNFPPSESALDCYGEPVVRQRLERLRQQVDGPAVRWETETDEGGIAWQISMALVALLLLVEPLIANARSES